MPTSPQPAYHQTGHFSQPKPFWQPKVEQMRCLSLFTSVLAGRGGIRTGGSEPPSPVFQPAIQVGQRLLGLGIEIFAFQPEFIGSSVHSSDSGENGLLELVSSASRMQRLPDFPTTQTSASSASDEIQELAGGSLAGSLSIYDEMSNEVTLVPGSAFPPAAEGPTWLIWRRGLLPALRTHPNLRSHAHAARPYPYQSFRTRRVYRCRRPA